MAEGVAGYGVTRAAARAVGRLLPLTISWYLVVSSLMFVLGAVGVLDPPQPARRAPLPRADAERRQPRAARLRAHVGNGDGQIFAIVVMVVAACEVAIGLGIIVALYRHRLPVDIDELRELHG